MLGTELFKEYAKKVGPALGGLGVKLEEPFSSDSAISSLGFPVLSQKGGVGRGFLLIAGFLK
jgi:hypothetical protein